MDPYNGDDLQTTSPTQIHKGKKTRDFFFRISKTELFNFFKLFFSFRGKLISKFKEKKFNGWTVLLVIKTATIKFEPIFFLRPKKKETLFMESKYV